MINPRQRNVIRQRVHTRIREKLAGTAERPRLNVYRSLNHIYTQLIDDASGTTIVAASSAGKKGEEKAYGGNVEAAKLVGKLIADKAQEKGIRKIVFDRGGYLYHGRVKALADAAREAGLDFRRNFKLFGLAVGDSGQEKYGYAEKIDANRLNLKDEVVSINRVTKVVKGGKNMSFAALVVIGDPAEGVVGYGSGKAKEVPQAIRKGIEAAKKNLFKINLTATTIPHQVLGHFGAGEVMLKPAPEGTGVIAGKTVRAVMTSCGIQNVLTKSLGTANPHNVVKATFDALVQLRDRAEVAAGRGKSVEEL